MARAMGYGSFAPCMFKNTVKSCSIQHAASRASKRSEKPAKRRPTADRSAPGAHRRRLGGGGDDADPERDRRRPRVLNPNSRLNATACGSSHPQGREATMQQTQYDSTTASTSTSTS